MNTVRAQGIRPFAAPAAHADGEAGLEQEDAATCHDAPGEGKTVGFGGQSSRRISITPRVSEGMKELLALLERLSLVKYREVMEENEVRALVLSLRSV